MEQDKGTTRLPNELNGTSDSNRINVLQLFVKSLVMAVIRSAKFRGEFVIRRGKSTKEKANYSLKLIQQEIEGKQVSCWTGELNPAKDETESIYGERGLLALVAAFIARSMHGQKAGKVPAVLYQRVRNAFEKMDTAEFKTSLRAVLYEGKVSEKKSAPTLVAFRFQGGETPEFTFRISSADDENFKRAKDLAVLTGAELMLIDKANEREFAVAETETIAEQLEKFAQPVIDTETVEISEPEEQEQEIEAVA